jgi:hypothetical protein
MHPAPIHNFWCAREASANAGESPAGAIRRFGTEASTNCVAAKRGGEQVLWTNQQAAMKMNHRNEPRKCTPGSRIPRIWMKTEECQPETIVGAGTMDRRGLRGQHAGKWRTGKRGDLN